MTCDEKKIWQRLHLNRDKITIKLSSLSVRLLGIIGVIVSYHHV